MLHLIVESLCSPYHLFLGIFFISLFISSVTCSLFRNTLFNINMFAFFTFFFLCLIYSFIVLRSEKILGTISIFLNLLRLDLWPKMWSILENVPCVLKKKKILMHLGEMSQRYQLDSSGIMCHLRLVFP